MKKVWIERIKVEKLFGLYDYEIPSKDERKNIETVLILYGDNGLGKTTILRLIFHLLACEREEGHKTFVAQTKFRSFVLDFSNSYEVRALRKGESLLGSFGMELRKSGKTVVKTEFLADAENSVKAGGPKDKENNEFLERLGKLNLSLYLLGDDRTVKITSPVRLPRYILRRSLFEEGVHIGAWQSRIMERERELDPEQIAIMLLEESMKRLSGWIRNHVMRGSRRGESNVNIIFSDIIENIATEVRRGRRKKATMREYLTQRISQIEHRNKNFSKFGLTPSFNGQKLLDSIGKSSTEKFKSIRPIIVPYLDSFEAKLDALDQIQETVEKFISTINSFMVDKTIGFHIARGFKIESRNKEELSPAMLSSGERHLLLLFCNAVTAFGEQSIFIIDEPEISLNVKWQRTLISSLLDCAKNSPVQYIFASHSMEILSQQLDRVVKLENTRY
jgi:energy-coupling factor transporter ATP-binding protein EcfA2